MRCRIAVCFPWGAALAAAFLVGAGACRLLHAQAPQGEAEFEKYRRYSLAWRDQNVKHANYWAAKAVQVANAQFSAAPAQRTSWVRRTGELVAPALAHGNPETFQTCLRFAKHVKESGDLRRASEIYSSVRRAAGGQDAERFGPIWREAALNDVYCCLALCDASRKRGADDARSWFDQAATVAPDLAAAAQEVAHQERTFSDTVRALIERGIWRQRWEWANEQIAREAAPAAVLTEVEREIDHFEQALRQRGVDPGWATLGRLWQAQLALNCGLQDRMAEPLDRCRACLASPLVPRYDKMRYWTLHADFDLHRRRFDQAIACYEKALTLAADPAWKDVAARSFEEAVCRNNFAKLLLRLGDPQKARDQLNRAESLHRQAKDAGLTTDNTVDLRWVAINKAMALQRIGGHENVGQVERLLLDAARDDPKRADAYAWSARITALNNLGMLHYAQGDLPAGIEHLTQAERLARHVFPARDVRLAELQVNRSWLALEQEQDALAEAGFQQALEVFQKQYGRTRPRTAECLSYLARALARQRDGSGAAQRLRQALDLRQEYVETTLRSALSERERLAFLQDLREHREVHPWPGVLDAFLELAPQLGLPADEQYRRVLHWKGTLAGSSLPFAADASGELRQLVEQRERVVQQMRLLSRRKFDLIKQDQRTSTIDVRLSALEDQANALERSLRRLQVAPPVALPALAVQAVAAALPPHALLLDILAYRPYQEPGTAPTDGRRYVAFAVAPDGRVARLDLGDAKTRDDEIETFRRSLFEPILSGPNRALTESGAAQGSALAGVLHDRLQPHLAGVRTLIVSPDGAFHRLPWPALRGAKTKHWIEELAFATVPSARSLLPAPRSPKQAPRAWFAAAGIEYGTPSQPQSGRVVWPFLRDSQEHGQAIAEILQAKFPAGSGELAVGPHATSRRMVEALPKHRFVHICTHGYFADDGQDQFDAYSVAARLDSALVMAGANAAADDDASALLTAHDLRRLDLSGVDVVTLSACESGLAHVAQGQGLVGLTAALEEAGVGAVVSASWEVSALSTDLLMQEFYRRLLVDPQNLRPADALREAQLTLLRDPKFAAPYHWAAWTAQGRPQLP